MGTVSTDRTFTSYTVEGDSITAFQVVRAKAALSAIASAPRSFTFPTLSDPEGTKLLVEILAGPFAGSWISPDDPGVAYRGNVAR